MSATLVVFSLVLAAAAPLPAQAPGLELVESAPIETTLRHAELASASDVWLEMVRGAKSSLDFAEFYASTEKGSRLEPILEAIEEAARRGVRVRFFVDAGFAQHEPGALPRLEKMPGVTVRRFDWAKVVGGGIHHAKYIVVDGKEAFLGSQNFDWRSLEHIQELGLRIRSLEIVRALANVFEMDWALAGGAPRPAAPASSPHFPIELDGARVSFVATPKDWLPDESEWSLPKLVALIDGAKKRVRAQVLTYQAVEHKAYFAELEDALRRAAARGVEVQLVVSDWSKRPSTMPGLKSLAVLPHVGVRMMSIPQWSGGFVAYARVVHAKYLVVDGEKAWVGTSNWAGDYFYRSRNVGLVIEGGPLPAELDHFFEGNWTSTYAVPVDAAVTYAAPRTGP